MFDDKEKPVDMFAETETESPRVSVPPQPSAGVPPKVMPLSQQNDGSSFITKKNIVIAGISVFALGLGAVGVQFFLYSAQSGVSQPVIKNEPQAQTTELVQPLPPQPTDTNQGFPTPDQGFESAPMTAPGIQSGDGASLPQSPEQPSAGLGAPDGELVPLSAEPASPESVPNGDADADGLTDDKELLFGTNPVSPDTDGDSYQDGEEVQNGYNPLGPGKMTDEQKTKLGVQ